MQKLRFTWGLIKETIREFDNDNLIHFSASLSFYILISMPSIAYVFIVGLGELVGQAFIADEISEELVSLFGYERAMVIQNMINKTSTFNPEPVLKVMSLSLLIFTSTGVFIVIRDTLNVIWKVRESHNRAFFKALENRVLSFVMVLVVAFIYFVSILVEGLLVAISVYIKEIDISLIFYLNILISFVIYTFLFALICKIMSRVTLLWKSLWPASIPAALFFMVGKYLMIKYLAVMDYNSTYAAGAVIVILLWIFYSSYVFCFASEFTQVYVRKTREEVHLKPYTVRMGKNC